MKKGEKKDLTDNMSLPHPSSSDLRGRQSVRATFKLSERAIEALSIVSVHLGIKQKSLFDHLLEDIESLRMIAHEIQSEKLRRLNRVQKTFVISRKTLSSLDEASRSFETPRDALVEQSIRRLLPLIENEKEKHRRRKAVLKELSEYMNQGKELLRETKESLGEDDPVYERFESVMAAMYGAYISVESFIDKGEVIEDF